MSEYFAGAVMNLLAGYADATPLRAVETTDSVWIGIQDITSGQVWEVGASGPRIGKPIYKKDAVWANKVGYDGHLSNNRVLDDARDLSWERTREVLQWFLDESDTR